MSREVVEVFVPCGGSTSEARAKAEKRHPGATVYVFTETDRRFARAHRSVEVGSWETPDGVYLVRVFRPKTRRDLLGCSQTSGPGDVVAPRDPANAVEER